MLDMVEREPVSTIDVEFFGPRSANLLNGCYRHIARDKIESQCVVKVDIEGFLLIFRSQLGTVKFLKIGDKSFEAFVTGESCIVDRTTRNVGTKSFPVKGVIWLLCGSITAESGEH